MFRTIMIALDGSAEAEAVVPVASALARARYAELVLVRVVADRHATTAEQVDADEYLNDVIRRHDLGDLRLRTELRHGDVAGQLLAAAREANADLIAMATHGRHGVARAWFGSVTERMLAESPVPVLALRAGDQPPARLQRLLIPLDNSPRSAAALALARDFAALTAAHLQLLQVVEPEPVRASEAEIAPIWEEDLRIGVQAALDRIVARLYARGIVATGEAAVGPIAETIGRVARESGTDLIIMGTHGFVGPRRALFGSVADEVVRTAGLPVILVREGNATPVNVAQHDAEDGPET